LNQGGINWTNHLTAYGVPVQQHQSLGQQRATIWADLKNNGEPKIKGLSLLEEDKLEAAEYLFAQMASYGFFIVQVGELERWLEKLTVARSKHVWLREIFTAMGDDPTHVAYQKPDDDPVWDFIGGLNNWLKNPRRRGIRK
jgi:hypothetical protein